MSDLKISRYVILWRVVLIIWYMIWQGMADIKCILILCSDAHNDNKTNNITKKCKNNKTSQQPNP